MSCGRRWVARAQPQSRSGRSFEDGSDDREARRDGAAAALTPLSGCCSRRGRKRVPCQACIARGAA
eukprot:2995867-Pleurochrysis_carterae.AAC.2